MKRMVECAALVLVFCVLIQATASGDSGHQRPYFSITGKATLTLDTTTGYWAYVESGIANHLGQADNFSTGTVDPSGSLTGTGTVTVSNGDKIFYDTAGQLGGTIQVFLTGGTGRFVNATGELTLGEPQNMETIQHGPLMIQRYDSSFEGWINY